MTTTDTGTTTPARPRWGQQVRDGFDAAALEEATAERGAGRASDRAEPADAYQVLRECPTYDGAQEIVDHLSDRGFPVATTRIVSVGLRRVETVTGRLTTARAAWRGAVNGAGTGVVLGAMIGLVMGSWTAFAVALGLWVAGAAAWGAMLGGVAHALTGGRRDFSTRTVYEAGSYQVQVETAYLAQARDALRQRD